MLLWPHPTRFLCPWDNLGKNTRVGCHFLLQGIFPIQESNLHHLYWQADSLPLSHQFSSLQSLTRVRLLRPHEPQHNSLSITNSQSLPKLISVESVMPSNHLILCSPLLLLPSIFPIIRVFSNESALHIRWAKYWNFSFNISPSNEHSGLISFSVDWLDLAVQGTLKSLLQHHS